MVTLNGATPLVGVILGAEAGKVGFKDEIQTVWFRD